MCDCPRRSTQVGALPVQPRETGVQRAEEPRTSTSNQRLCLKCKRYGHIARECTYSSPSAKKADAGMIAMAPQRHEKRFSSKRKSSYEEKAVVNLRTPYLCDEVKALCIPDATCYAIVGNMEGARGPEDPDMSVMVSGATSRAQTLHETATRPLQMLPTRSGTVELIVTS
ncbi:hypothetical protein PoB_001692900 [Plakobranchus ocellatus]|uniref:CCHC-type domain-containing protein n=1 Tax=Plakobranchus ocellatus TaxID=259542 RepID=A0AAV3Z7Q8_9GAST|nr:hypothetical protein PoB_001692900 [Plakobranchus ocellatus]